MKILLESIHKHYKAVVFLFFGAYLTLGISIFGNYGISWDEFIQRTTGIVYVRYITEGNLDISTYKDRDHGAAFEMLLAGFEKIPGLVKTVRDIYLMRHLLIFLIFYTGVFFFYLLCKERFKSWKIGLLGSLFLILTPRIFAHSFYNSKDIAFLAMFIMSIFTLIRYLDHKNWRWAFLHAFACALLIDTRINGVIVPFLTGIFFVGDFLFIRRVRLAWKKNLVSFSVFIIFLIALTILFWPTLWAHPIASFIECFHKMSHYAWAGEVLYFGKYVSGTSIPWHYIPVWMGMTIPADYLVYFMMGCLVMAISMFTKKENFYENRRNDFIFLAWLFIPLFIVIVLKSVLYDEWRQMFFIYPPFLILSLGGLVSFSQFIRNKIKGAPQKIIYFSMIVIVAVNLIGTAVEMVKYHPLQNLYFNILAGQNMERIKDNFELDYWGLSYRKALEYILSHDPAEKINLVVANPPGLTNSYILPPDERKRLVYVSDPREAKYFLSNYRLHKQEYNLPNEFYSIKIGGAKIMVVYKLQ